MLDRIEFLKTLSSLHTQKQKYGIGIDQKMTSRLEKLGKGGYGSVYCSGGYAMKTFSYLPHMIQECTALHYVKNCTHLVKIIDFDIRSLSLRMELFDTDYLQWLRRHLKTTDKNTLVQNRKMIELILRDVLMGLVELHDRDLVHGDIKANNILIKYDPPRAVIGDCGFVSISKYAKVNRTAKNYKEEVISKSWTHDMYAYGLILIQSFCNFRIVTRHSYQELRQIIDRYPLDKNIKVILKRTVSETKSERPTSRELLYMLFGITLPEYQPPEIPRFKQITNKKLLKSLAYTFDVECHKHTINRSGIATKALYSYMLENNIPLNNVKLYAACMLVIISSHFGNTGSEDTEKRFTMLDVYSMCGDDHTPDTINEVLSKLCTDTKLLNAIFRKSIDNVVKYDIM